MPLLLKCNDNPIELEEEEADLEESDLVSSNSQTNGSFSVLDSIDGDMRKRLIKMQDINLQKKSIFQRKIEDKEKLEMKNNGNLKRIKSFALGTDLQNYLIQQDNLSQNLN